MMKRTNVVVIGIVVAVSFPLFAAVMAPRTDLSDDLGTGSRRWGSAYIGHLSATNTDTSAEVDAKIDAIDAKVAETVPYTGATNDVDLGAHDIAAGNLSGNNTGDGTVSDSAELDFALTGSDITASLIAASIDETKLDASVNDSLDLADSAIQTELDPVFDASQAANIDAGDITNLGNLSGNNTGDEDLSVYDTSTEVDAKVAASTNISRHAAWEVDEAGEIVMNRVVQWERDGIDLSPSIELVSDEFFEVDASGYLVLKEGP